MGRGWAIGPGVYWYSATLNTNKPAYMCGIIIAGIANKCVFKLICINRN